MMRPDSPSWTAAKAAGDAAEIAVAKWWREQGYMVHKTIGLADHDLRVTADVEVKHDLQAERTGRVAVEVSYGHQASGLVTSSAQWWAIVVGEEAFIIGAATLRELAFQPHWPERDAGDGGKARVRLVPVHELRRASHVVTLGVKP